ncbi:hypothetical protein BDV59DRAFT_201747 [Aspergillus ambiguus]|uniref:uncharacterized protein n=1 Tax=Aspergillus ambiguus TaxID=176160 RepID=UPI003CCD4575
MDPASRAINFRIQFQNLRHQLAAQEITLLLLQASIALSHAQDTKAEQLVRRALHIVSSAPEPRDPKHAARCQYWLGRIAWFRDKPTQARGCFRAARAEDGLRGLREGHEIDEYLFLLQRGVRYAHRGGQQDPLPTSQREGESSKDYKNPRKRKRWELTRRSPQVKLSSKVKSTPPHKVDSEQQSHCLPRVQFRFRMYPTGLASRTRPTNIFAEQEYEGLIPAEKWEVIRQKNEGRVVTMEFLKGERVRMWRSLRKLCLFLC